MIHVYQKALVSRTLQSLRPIRVDSLAVHTVLDNYEKHILQDKQTDLRIAQKEDSFRKELIQNCTYINGPELKRIEDDLAATSKAINIRAGSVCLLMTAGFCSIFLLSVVPLVVAIPMHVGVRYAYRDQCKQHEEAWKRIEILREFEKRIINVPNTEIVIEKLQ